VVAHDCSRGSWTCFETRGLPDWTPAGGYATPAQAVVPLHVRWMLLFQDPLHGTAELLKATPRAWLSAGERIAVRRAPLGRRRLSFVVASQLGGSSEGSPSISANISLEDAGPRSGRRAAERQDGRTQTPVRRLPRLLCICGRLARGAAAWCLSKSAGSRGLSLTLRRSECACLRWALQKL
jgi:hypothetical protein